jgi:hypothetical protein
MFTDILETPSSIFGTFQPKVIPSGKPDICFSRNNLHCKKTGNEKTKTKREKNYVIFLHNINKIEKMAESLYDFTVTKLDGKQVKSVF